MGTFHSGTLQRAGEAALLAHEGDRIVARAVFDGARRLLRGGLARLGLLRVTAGEG